MCEYLPHISSCLLILHTEHVWLLGTMKSHCTWCSSRCETLESALPLGVVAIVRLGGFVVSLNSRQLQQAALQA
jgi:hypothetical protein